MFSTQPTVLMSWILAVAIASVAFALSVDAVNSSDAPMCLDSYTDCYLKHLGPPRTQEEWLLAYVSALAERCMASQISSCNGDQFCTVVIPGVPFDQYRRITNSATPDQEIQRQIDQGLIANVKDPKCVLDLPRFLGRPCIGSRDDVLQKCGAQTNSKDCNKDATCIWLRNGWWLENSSNKTATMLSNERLDTTVMALGGVPPSYACWPKWHVPYAIAKWPYTQWNLDISTDLSLLTLYQLAYGKLPLPCPFLASFYPCILNTQWHDASLKALTGVDVTGNASQCINLAGLDGVCPHQKVARKVLTGLERGWNLSGASSAQAATLIADCAHHTPQLNGLRLVKSPCIMQTFSWFSAYGSNQLPRRCGDVGFVPIVGAECGNITANKTEVDAADAHDRCLITLVSSSLWEGLGHLLLKPGTKEAVNSWYDRLHSAEKQCGSFDDWQHQCVVRASKQASDVHGATLNSIISQYERLFLMDASGYATRATNVVYRCQSSLVRVYMALAAVWIAYAGVMLLGFVALMIYWHGCERWCKRRRARRAQQLLMRGVQARKAPVAVPQQTWRKWVMEFILWLKPRLHAVMFLADVGLDVYTLVKLTSSRWMWHMVVAILTPYGLMSMLLFRTCIGYCCSWCCVPAVWWYDVRMLFCLMGVHVPVFGDSKIDVGQYAHLRLLFEGVFEAVPSALISTAVLYDNLGLQSTVRAIPTAVLWINLVSSFVRGASEVWGLALLTHQRGYCCFVTTIAHMAWDMRPYPHAATSGDPTPPATVAPQLQVGGQMLPPVQEQPLTSCNSAQARAAITGPGSSSETLHGGVSDFEDGIMGDLERHCDCNCHAARACCNPSASGIPCRLVLYVWFCVCSTTIICLLNCITIGCGGLLNRATIATPFYHFGGEATCGAGSLFNALYMGSSGSCTLPNLEIV